MDEYGMTPSGLSIKRLDVILDEMHEDLSDSWGVNTRQNPESFINFLLTIVADKIAELWELGSDVYYSQSPDTAEGIYLDNAAQYSGATREAEAPSYYNVLCTGFDGTVVPSSTIITTETYPKTQLQLVKQGTISVSTFNKVKVKVSTNEVSLYTVAVNGSVYSYTPASAMSDLDILTALAALITAADFTVSVDSENTLLKIESDDPISGNVLLLSDNLTTENVGTVLRFATSENGDIFLPEGAVNTIVKSVAGLQSVVNVGTYIAGRLAESDAEFRKSYADKIFSRSSMMLNSIKSAILNNCAGVDSAMGYENDSNETDAQGRVPHSIEIVVDGGDNTEIAKQILEKKAGGISTNGSVSVDINGDNGETITIRFNRPTYVTIWFKVEITMATGQSLPANYVQLVRDAITSSIGALGCGEDVIPQKDILPKIYKTVTGISYADIAMESGSTQPVTYTQRSITISQRERAVTDDLKIEVVLDA